MIFLQYSKVEICGINTNELPCIKDNRAKHLLKSAQSGDKAAREELVNGNLRLVLSVVQRFANRGENPDDLFQVGVIGLIKAIDNFNTELDVKLSTYAVPMIIGEIRRYLRDNNPVRVSRSLRDMAYHAMQAKEELQNKLSREPTIDEIAKKMEVPLSEVVIALEAIVDPVSLYEPIYNDGGDTIFVMDQIGDKNTDEAWIDEIMLRDSLKSLGLREKEILSKRFMEGKTQMEVAEEIGISQAQVSRLEKSALRRIKQK